LDAIFLSPPWGGPEYLAKGPNQYNLLCIHLPQTCKTSSSTTPLLSSPEQRSDSITLDENWCAHVDDDNGRCTNRTEINVKPEEVAGIKSKGLQAFETATARTGQDLLKLALGALNQHKKRIIYYLPRNTNGLALAQSIYECGYGGSIELEQILLNRKLKAVAMYLDT
jgi:hypothetical protein